MIDSPPKLDSVSPPFNFWHILCVDDACALSLFDIPVTHIIRASQVQQTHWMQSLNGNNNSHSTLNERQSQKRKRESAREWVKRIFFWKKNSYIYTTYIHILCYITSKLNDFSCHGSWMTLCALFKSYRTPNNTRPDKILLSFGNSLHIRLYQPAS